MPLSAHALPAVDVKFDASPFDRLIDNAAKEFSAEDAFLAEAAFSGGFLPRSTDAASRLLRSEDFLLMMKTWVSQYLAIMMTRSRIPGEARYGMAPNLSKLPPHLADELRSIGDMVMGCRAVDGLSREDQVLDQALTRLSLREDIVADVSRAITQRVFHTAAVSHSEIDGAKHELF